MVHGVDAADREFAFQLVVQFQAESSGESDDLLSFYDNVTQAVESGSAAAVLDGHDCGAGEFNFFICTDYPEDIVLRVQQAFALNPPKQTLRGIAYRRFEDDEYVVLWPTDLKQFSVA